MRDQIKMISAHEMFPLVEDVLKSGKQAVFTVTGNSMLPWIRHERDQVMLVSSRGVACTIGDIILFQGENGNYILHRIYKIVPGGYLTVGDACLQDDGLIQDKQIIGVVERIYRDGKMIECKSVLWHFVFMLWLKLKPIRKYLLNLYLILTRIKPKLLKLKLRIHGFISR